MLIKNDGDEARSVAHEIGHIIFKHAPTIDASGYHRNERDEAEADLFAKHLLTLIRENPNYALMAQSYSTSTNRSGGVIGAHL